MIILLPVKKYTTSSYAIVLRGEVQEKNLQDIYIYYIRACDQGTTSYSYLYKAQASIS